MPLSTPKQLFAPILANDDLIPGHKVLVCEAPAVAEQAQPGHFVNVLTAERTDPLLRKPFSVYTVDRGLGQISLLYSVGGATTSGMARKRPGDTLDLVGPLGGHVFQPDTRPGAAHILVGGGYGVPPLVFLSRELQSTYTDPDMVFVIGARRKDLLLCEMELKASGVDARTATEDGSHGTHGKVTDALAPLLAEREGKPVTVYCCGPTPMMRAVGDLCQSVGVPCQVSVEVSMPCGIGVCMGCVLDLADGRRVRCCVDGPVFEASEGQMVNTSVQIGRMTLRNPVMTGSGTFGFGPEMAGIVDLNALGAVVVKSTSLEARLGNPTPRIVETASGLLNAIGLQNSGVDNFIAEKLPFLRQYDVPVVVNLVGYEVGDYVLLAEKLSAAGGVHALEINISCPNVKHGCDFAVNPELTAELISAVRKVTDLTLITKLSPNVTDLVPIARAAVGAGSDALSLINTLLGTAIDIKKRKFKLANITGGLSGPAVKPVALRCVWQVHRALPDVPLIGMGGIVSAADAIEFLLAGATAVAVGTATFVNPTASTDIVSGIERYLEENGISDVNELIGAVS